jgi:hypothetical protein
MKSALKGFIDMATDRRDSKLRWRACTPAPAARIFRLSLRVENAIERLLSATTPYGCCWPFSPVPERLLLSQVVITHGLYRFLISPQASPLCRTALLHRWTAHGIDAAAFAQRNDRFSLVADAGRPWVAAVA